MAAGRAMPFVTTTVLFPPPAAAFLDPNPFTTTVGPLSPRDGQRSEHERVFVSIVRNPVADDDTRIADRSRDTQDFEVALRKIAQGIEIEHLTADIKKGVFGIVARGRGTDDHARGVRPLTGNAIRGAGVAAKCSQIGNAVENLCARLANNSEREKRDRKTEPFD